MDAYHSAVMSHSAKISVYSFLWTDLVTTLSVDEGVSLNATLSTNRAGTTFSILALGSTCNSADWSIAPSISPSTGVITGTPLEAAVGTCQLKVQADDSVSSIEKTITITIDDVAHAPTLSLGSSNYFVTSSGAGTIGSPLRFLVKEGSSDAVITYTATDADAADSITLNCSGSPTYLTINNTSQEIGFTPSFAQVGGPTAFSCVSSDGSLSSATTLYFSATVVTDPYVNLVSTSKADGYYPLGTVVDLSLTFNESVTVLGGIPTVTLETGATDHSATYVSGSPGTVLNFRYTVQAGDEAEKLDIHATTSQISLNSATLKGTATGLDAVLSLPVAADQGSLAGGHSIVIDTVAPTVASSTLSFPPEGLTSKQIKTKWAAASDNLTTAANLQYRVYYSTSNNIANAGTALSNGSAVAAYAANIASLAATGLTKNTNYYFNVLVKDQAGNVTAYTSDSMTTEDFCGGAGTNVSPYQICTLGDLNSMRDNLSAYYLVQNDIDASSTVTWNEGAGWLPVGDISASFRGSFDGGLKVIRGLTINRPLSDYLGLFGKVFSSGSFGRVGLQDAHIVGRNIVGTFIGEINYGGAVVQNTYSTGSVEAISNAGGLIGTATGITLSQLFSTATGINGAAGLLGNVGSASASYAYATGDSKLGSIARVAGASVDYFYSTGNVDSTKSMISPLISNIDHGATLSYAFSSGNLYTIGERVGGIIGWFRSTSTVKYAVSEGHLSSSYYTGGISGLSDSAAAISYSLATGKIAASAGERSLLTGNGGSTITSSYAFDRGDGVDCAAGGADPQCTKVTTGTAKPFTFNYDPLFNYVEQKYLESPSLAMRKIGYGDESAYSLKGGCTLQDANINISITDGSNTLNNSTTCKAFAWNLSIDLSSLADGPLTVSANQGGGTAKTLHLSKQTSLCASSPSDGDFASGDGSLAAPYLICTTAQFDKVRNYLASGTYFKLMNNLDLSSGFSGPIGNNSAEDCSSRFCGIFDGNGFVLRNAYLLLPGSSGVGIFGYVYGSTASLSKLGLENIHIIADGDAGTLAGIIEDATVSACYSQGHVMAVSTTVNSVGGLVGRVSSGVINHNWAYVHILSKGMYSGGLIGHIDRTVTQFFKNRAAGNIISSNSYAGGLVGVSPAYSVMRENISTGHVIGSGGAYSSHISRGRNNYDSYATGSVLSSGANSSGFSSAKVGNSNTLSTSYGSGHVISPGIKKSGLASTINNNDGSIVDSHFVGYIVTSLGSAGALVGVLGNYLGLHVESGNYWNHTAAPATCILLDNNPGDADYCNTAAVDYTQLSTFTSPTAIYDNWDFINIWKWPSVTGMPLLKWELEP